MNKFKIFLLRPPTVNGFIGAVWQIRGRNNTNPTETLSNNIGGRILFYEAINKKFEKVNLYITHKHRCINIEILKIICKGI